VPPEGIIEMNGEGVIFRLGHLCQLIVADGTPLPPPLRLLCFQASKEGAEEVLQTTAYSPSRMGQYVCGTVIGISTCQG
jgi:hypothetical protein